MEKMDLCKDAIVCKDKALKMTNEIEKFTKNAQILIESSEQLAEKADNMSKNVCQHKLTALEMEDKTMKEQNVVSENDSKIKNKDETNNVAKNVEKKVGMSVATGISGMLANKNSYTVKPLCVDGECLKLAKNLANILKSGKNHAIQNEDLATRLKSSAEDFVKSLDMTIQESHQAHTLLNNAIGLAEKIASGQCSEEDLKSLKIVADESFASIILPSTQQYIVSAREKFQETAECLRGKIDKMKSNALLGDISVFFVGIPVGLFCGYFMAHAYKSYNGYETIRKLWKNKSAREKKSKTNYLK